MGCDIHVHIEVKINDEWLYYAPAPINRNYELFARMANCGRRTDITPIAPNRGLPIDVTQMTHIHRLYWGIDGHSTSWLGEHEIAILEEEFKDLGKFSRPHGFLSDNKIYLFGNYVGGRQKYPEDYPEFIQDVRIIFWFDN